MSSGYVECRALLEPEKIRELEPMFTDGSEYLLRVVLTDGDHAFGCYMTAEALELAPFLFAQEAARR